MNPTSLNKWQKKCVKRWSLAKEEQKRITCPFKSKPHILKSCFRGFIYEVCRTWFPKTAKTEHCPCTVYLTSYVIRRAKEMVKKGNKK